MIYRTAEEWLGAEQKRVLLFGMSGLGKTHVSNMLRASGDWFHYSIDYRIGTRYMGEHIADNFKREAMKVPLLRDLLMTDSVHITSNITFNNLSPLSTYLGKPGDAARGGLPFAEYQRRQDQHRTAEIAALHDTGHFANRAHDLYGYANFVCDSGGSICEVVDPEDASDPVLTDLSQTVLMIWIRGDESHRAELIRRFDRDPKPIYYQPEFLLNAWADYLNQEDQPADRVDPDGFLRFAYARLLDHRQPRYDAMARNWGLTVPAESVASLRTAADFASLVADALEKTR
ncbi:ATPase [Defluviimonas sp. WL0002]|uniref:ATPase n=1 Tax=Albidovulum marisflavi TaxID=2984159 RepID=A0ABT2ZIG9_9RHOB|nr:ATPase [Defluviimonas sp. WL0002]MCV2870526.1 ATPase [Defluviimonas sp. WL0002]